MTKFFEPIETTRCRIAPLRNEDARAVQAITDASVTSSIHFLASPFTLPDAERLIASSDQTHRFFGVWTRGGVDLLGVVGVHQKPSSVEIGYWLSVHARGKGFAGEAVRAVVKALASRNPASRIIAECHPDNRRSWALLERIGFAPTGEAGDRPGRMLLSWVEEPNYRIDVC